MVDVFPITTAAFGLQADWFERYATRLIEPSYLLMVLLLVISVGIMVLKRFKNADLEKKLWNLPVIITLVVFWPSLVLSLKSLIDAFNTFLVQEIFQIRWEGFGYPNLDSVSGIFGWSAEALARLLPNLAYWILYAFYIVFFFFYAVLGPFILAKGILFDEIEAFLEIVKEITILFLWQTTTVILVAFVLPDIVSGRPFPSESESSFFFLSLILGILLFFVPSVTRKFGNHLGSSFFPPGFRWGGAFVGLTAAGMVSTRAVAAAGLPLPGAGHWRHSILHAEEFAHRNHIERHNEHVETENEHLEHKLKDYQYKKEQKESTPINHKKDSGAGTSGPNAQSTLLDFSKRAKSEMKKGE